MYLYGLYAYKYNDINHIRGYETVRDDDIMCIITVRARAWSPWTLADKRESREGVKTKLNTRETYTRACACSVRGVTMRQLSVHVYSFK